MADALKDLRIQLVISRPEVTRLDKWRAQQQIWSRSAAIRLLIERGLDREESKITAAVRSPAKQKAKS